MSWKASAPISALKTCPQRDFSSRYRPSLKKVNGCSSYSSSRIRAFSVLVAASWSSNWLRMPSITKSDSARMVSFCICSSAIFWFFSALRSFSSNSMRSLTIFCTRERCFEVTSSPASTMVCSKSSTLKTIGLRTEWPNFSFSSRSKRWPSAITGSNKSLTSSS